MHMSIFPHTPAPRTVQGVVGVADFNCTNETKLEILDLVKRETERRSQLQKNALKKKSTMRQGKRYKYIE